MSKEILVRLQELKGLLIALQSAASKPFDLAEAAAYLKISKSHLYQRTSRREIAHYKPEGKKIYFRREDLDAYLLRNRRQTSEQTAIEVASRIVHKPASEVRRPQRRKAKHHQAGGSQGE